MNTVALHGVERHRDPKWTHLLLNLSLVLFGLLVPLTLGEIAVRLSHHQTISFDDRSFRRSSWYFRPGTHDDSYVGVPVTINNLGLRGPNTTLEKPPGVFRIIGVGDSITFGYGARVEDTFLHVLEQNLNASASNGVRYEVINAGDPATGFEYYTHFIEDVAPSMHPDLILLCMALNDIDPQLEANPTEPVSNPTTFRLLNGFMLTHSRLYNALYVPTKSVFYQLNILHLKDNDGFGFLAIEPQSPEQDKARAGVDRYIQRIANFTRAHGQPLGIVVVPVEPQLSEKVLHLYERQLHLYLGPEALNGQPQRWIEQIGAKYSVPVLDLLPALRAGDNGQLYLRNKSISVDPVHLSPDGHRIAGDEITRFLKSPAFALAPGGSGDADSKEVKDRF